MPALVQHHLPGIEIQEVPSVRARPNLPHKIPLRRRSPTRWRPSDGLRILQEHIEDSPYNRTRFLVVGNTVTPPSGRDKTSLLFSVRHRAGSLFHTLSIFDKYDINLTMIESRPSKRTPWEYIFFIDFQGHQQEPTVQKALRRLQEDVQYMKVLGSYPEAE